MSSRDLLNFLLNEQREQATAEDALKLIEKHEVDGTGRFYATLHSIETLRVRFHIS